MTKKRVKRYSRPWIIFFLHGRDSQANKGNFIKRREEKGKMKRRVKTDERGCVSKGKNGDKVDDESYNGKWYLYGYQFSFPLFPLVSLAFSSSVSFSFTVKGKDKER